ncbi:MAG: hypothetical protein ABIL00_06455 [candidate division WOR-3 bacterium]
MEKVYTTKERNGMKQNIGQLPIAHRKRFMPYSICPNPLLSLRVAFMLERLYEIWLDGLTKDLKTDDGYYNKK